MKAVVLTGAGGTDMLKLMEVPDPVIEDPQEVLVRLHAAGLNPVDYKLRKAGGFYPDRLPLILGCDGAGVVEEIGEDVTKFNVGDEVFFFNGGMGGDEQGNYAERTIIHQDYLATKPNRLSMVDAASVPLVWLTAWEALFDRYALKPGDTVLIHAGAGGVGYVAIQIATGIEAISNGITAFREPRSRNAGITLIWMSSILGLLFLSITYLTTQIGAVPSESETVISQLARTVYGGQNIFYLAVIAGTSVILILAANTAFADFPRLSALQAGDGFLPRQLTYRGSRLVYSRGIALLAVIACALIILFQASVTALIPLYAIGVFLSFTLSQAGMARRWWKIGRLKPDEEVQEPGSVLRFDPRWQLKMAINGFGAVCTAIVMVVFAVTKFTEGAWIVLGTVSSALTCGSVKG